MKILILGDLHIGARNSNPVLFNMMKSFFNNTLFPYILDNDIKTVIQLGDIHDKRKSIDFVIAEYIINDFFKWFEDNNVKLISLVGNHDSYYKNTIKLDGMSQLTRKSNHITIVNKPSLYTFDNVKFAIVPWICDENKQECLEFIDKNKKSNAILLGHFELAGFEMVKGIKSETGNFDIGILSGYRKVISGHYHITSERDNVIYVGTPYELNWNDYNDKKRFIVYDTKDNEFEMVPTNIVLHEKIMYNDTLKKIDSSRVANKFVKVIANDDYSETKLNKFLIELNKSHPLSIQFIDNRQKKETEIAYAEDDLNNPPKIVLDDIQEYYKNNKEMYDLATRMFEDIHKEVMELDTI